jgi:Outer membrane protein beta-barrel domain
MKKTIYILLFSVALFVSAKAQKTNIGIVAGTNYSLDNSVLSNKHLGASAGVFVEVVFKSNVFLRGEATYLIKQRANLSYQQYDSYDIKSYTVGAWQFPVNVGYKFKLGAWQPYVQGGAYVHSAQNSLQNNTVGLSLEGRHREFIRPTAGTGVQFKKFALELEWQFGQKVTKADFNNSGNLATNGIAFWCMPPYPPYPSERTRGKSMGDFVRSDAFLLKLRYSLN